MSALKRYDFYICAVDNPVARFVAAFLATLYHRPLLDVASGVFLGKGPEDHIQTVEQEIAMRPQNSELFYEEMLPAALLGSGQRTMGADIRLLLPGRTDAVGNCLLCQGGIGNPEEVKRGLKQEPIRKRSARARPFWKRRAGSLWMLNSEAAGFAVRLVLAYLDGQISASRHWQMNTSLGIAPNWHLIDYPTPSHCSLCAHAGLGDDALDQLEHIL